MTNIQNNGTPSSRARTSNHKTDDLYQRSKSLWQWGINGPVTVTQAYGIRFRSPLKEMGSVRLACFKFLWLDLLPDMPANLTYFQLTSCFLLVSLSWILPTLITVLKVSQFDFSNHRPWWFPVAFNTHSLTYLVHSSQFGYPRRRLFLGFWRAFSSSFGQ
jgi:hypothetical protein